MKNLSVCEIIYLLEREQKKRNFYNDERDYYSKNQDFVNFCIASDNLERVEIRIDELLSALFLKLPELSNMNI